MSEHNKKNPNNNKGKTFPKTERDIPNNYEKRGRSLPETGQQQPPSSVPIKKSK